MQQQIRIAITDQADPDLSRKCREFLLDRVLDEQPVIESGPAAEDLPADVPRNTLAEDDAQFRARMEELHRRSLEGGRGA